MASQLGKFSTEKRLSSLKYLLRVRINCLYVFAVPSESTFPKANNWRRFCIALPRVTGETREIPHSRSSSRTNGRPVVWARPCPRSNFPRTAAFRASGRTAPPLLQSGQQ
jgi:hypothetical protein